MATLDCLEGRDSLSRLIVRMRPSLERILGRYGVPPEDAEDILQDSQLTLLYKWEKIQNPEAWLLGTVRNKCIVYWRKERAKMWAAVDTAILDLLAEPQAPAQEKLATRRDLSKVLARLPARCQELLRLRYGLGLKPAEIARHMGYQPSSVRKVTHRCLASLLRELTASGLTEKRDDDAHG